MATSGQLGKFTQNGMFAGGMAPVTPVTGVQSISGNGVDNTNPAAPVINATADDTANTIVYRDVNGQAEIAVPTTGPQIANKNYVDAQIDIVETALAAKLTATQGAAQADSVAADTAAMVVDFNALLAKLRTAGIIDT